MIKKFLAVAFLFPLVSAHAACNVNFDSASDEVHKVVMRNGWNFNKYDEICRRLTHERASLLINGHATVLGGQSIGWASVILKDAKLPIVTSAYGGTSTMSHTFASMDKAQELLYQSINDAVGNVDWDEAFAALNAARQSARASLRK